MKIIECWDIQVWDGGDRHVHKHYVATEEAADDWIAEHQFDHVSKLQLVIFDNLDEINDYELGKARERALAKLTDKERNALGFK
jgi:hypothetical protein